MSLPTDNWVSNPEETHGPVTSVSCWSLVGVSFVFLALRLSVRYRSTKLWIDDLILAISWLSLLSEVTMVQMSINLGFGKHALDIDLSHMDMIAVYGACGLTLSTIAINLSKISFGVTLLRLTITTSWAKGYVWFAIATLIIFSIPAAVMPWIQCKPLVKTFVDIFPGECIDKRPTIRFGEFQAIWAALMDFSLALIPWVILWNVQMRRTEKVGVGIAMSLGILAGSASIVRGMYLNQLTKQDISYDATKSVIWTAAESAVTIIATSIPVLRVFIRNSVGSAMGYIHNSSGRSRTTSAPRSPGWSRNAPDSIQSSTVLSKKEQSLSTSKSSHLSRNTKEWIILEDTAPTHGSHRSIEDA